MINTGRTIIKNASVMLFAQMITFSLGLVLTIVLPRFLGPSAVGKIHLAVSFWAILGLLITFGMDMLLTKEVARSPEEIPGLFGNTISLRTIFFVLALGIFALYVSIARYPLDTIIVLFIIGITAFIERLSGATQAMLRGLEKMEYISIAVIVNKVVVTVSIVVFLLLGYGLFVVAAIGTVGVSIELLILLISLRKFASIRLIFDWSKIKWLLRESVPYLTTTMFLVIYVQIDVIIISLLVDETTVGWYSTADHLFSTFLFIPGILMMAIFPALSRTYYQDAGSTTRFVRRGFRWLLLVGVPIGIGLIVVSDSIVALLYGPEFANSAPVLAVDGVVLILMFLTILIAWTLVAMDRQKQWAIVMAIAVLASILLDIVLIPWCAHTFGNGAIGGSLAFVITEFGMILIGLYLLPKGTFRWSDGFFAARVLVAGLLMGLVAWWWRDSFIAIPIVIGAVVYLALILLLRAIPREDLEMLRWLGRSVFQRLRLRFMRSQISGSP